MVETLKKDSCVLEMKAILPFRTCYYSTRIIGQNPKLSGSGKIGRSPLRQTFMIKDCDYPSIIREEATGGIGGRRRKRRRV